MWHVGICPRCQKTLCTAHGDVGRHECRSPESGETEAERLWRVGLQWMSFLRSSGSVGRLVQVACQLLAEVPFDRWGQDRLLEYASVMTRIERVLQELWILCSYFLRAAGRDEFPDLPKAKVDEYVHRV